MDFNKLRLKYHGSPDKMWEILQSECRYKTASKLSETLKNPKFTFPSLSVAEMATSDAVADIHTRIISPGASVLDMTCGLGIDTFHLARKAASVVTIELNHESYLTAAKNRKVLGLNNVTVIEGDSVKWLTDNENHFDVIFIDPARRDSAGRHFLLKDCTPDVTEIIGLLMNRCNALLIKCSPMISMDAAIRELNVDCDIAVIGTKKECKEVLLIAQNHKSTSERTIKCITIDGEWIEFTLSEEKKACVEYGVPSNGEYLYEPYPSVMKGGCYRILSERYKIKKLNPNTHLYHANYHADNFPGDIFEIEAIIPFSKSEIKRFSSLYPIVNVTTRNFPLSAPELVKKLKVKEGGNKIVFGVTECDSNKVLIVAHQIISRSAESR